jgi:hypothetical protein
VLQVSINVIDCALLGSSQPKRQLPVKARYQFTIVIDAGRLMMPVPVTHLAQTGLVRQQFLKSQPLLGRVTALHEPVHVNVQRRTMQQLQC